MPLYKMLVCNWLHSIGQNHFYIMMLFNRDSAIRSSSRRFCTVYESVKSDPLQPFRWRDILSERSDVQASSVRKTRTFRPELPLCREASNCPRLHSSGRFSSTSEHHSVFDQLWDFNPKHRYGKTTAPVRTIWIPVRTRSCIRQVVHSISRRLDVSPHGPDSWASYMEIGCIRSTIQTTDPMVRTHEPLIWKLRATKCDRPDDRATPSGRGSIQERISAKFGKPVEQLSVRMPYVYHSDSL